MVHIGGKNDRNFDNLETTLEELKSFFFYSLFPWTFAYLAQLFKFPCSIFSLVLGVLLYTSYVLGLHSSALFDKYNITYIYNKKNFKKKKKIQNGAPVT